MGVDRARRLGSLAHGTDTARGYTGRRDTGIAPPVRATPAAAGVAVTAGAAAASADPGRLHAVRRAGRSLPRVLSRLGNAAVGSD